MSGRLLSLDDPAARDPSVAGAKASWLAEGRRAGLDVLPGLVVPAGCSRDPLARGVEALPVRGSGGARLVVAGAPLDPSLAADLAGVGQQLGNRLVARSSSRLESGGEWAGAFTSYVDIAPDELSTAVRGCWASAFSVDALRRFEAAGIEPGSAAMAVLIQPAVEPVSGGAARLVGEDAVEVTGGPGSPVAVLQGWEPGVVARVSGETISGADARHVLGDETLHSVAAAVHQAAARTGATAIEWALVEGRIVLLQLGIAPRTAPPGRPTLPDALRDPLALALARLARRAPGPLGEALVLPWAIAAPDLVSELLDESSRGDAPVPGRAAGDAHRLAAELTAGVWAEAEEDAVAFLSNLRGADPGAALGRIEMLTSPDPGAARALVAAFLALAAGRRGHPLGRVGIDRWEPFSAAVTMANADPVPGVAASGGIGAGRMAWVPDPRHAAAFRPRDVLVAPRPLPQLAPLLWDAAGVVTLGGGPGAHLLESARALGIPAVTGIGAHALGPLPPSEPVCLALDGWSGEVFAVPW